MLQPYRRIFNNEQFSPSRYGHLLTQMAVRTRTPVEFRVAETPCFFPKALLEEMAAIGAELTHQLIDSPDYMRRSEDAIPNRYRVPGDNPKPNFMTVDFGLVRTQDGRIEPKLVELQAFPSILGYQDILNEEYVRSYGLDEHLAWRLSGLTEKEYWALLARTILGSHDPENVVLLEVEPDLQKTRPDFRVYEDRLGLATVDIARVKKRSNSLFYERDGRDILIKRIYNRAIVDEIERKRIQLPFDYRDELTVEWAGQPNWFFRISKFSLPYLNHPCVPKAVVLEDWFAGRREGLPDDRAELLLKPLYSFAGKGIQFAPSDAELRAIPERDRKDYLLQERVHFAPLIDTPCGPTQAEVRVMYLWPDGAEELTPVITLVRMGRGLMMGVDHNRDQAWVGGSGALFPTI